LIEAEQQGALMRTLAQHEMRPQRKELGDVLCELHNLGLVDLTSEQNLSAIDVLEHNDFWIIFYPLYTAIPNLQCSHLQVLGLVRRLVEKAGRDGTAGMPNSSLVTWSRNNPSKARDIISGIKELDELCLAHGLFAVLGLDEEALAFDLIRHTSNLVRGIGLRALGRMTTLSDDGISNGLDEAAGVIEYEADPNIRFAAIEASFKLWEKSRETSTYRQRELIEALGNNGDANELSSLSTMLFYHRDGLPKETINQILGLLETIPSNSSVTLANLDDSIEKDDDRWDFVRVVSVFSTCIPRITERSGRNTYHNFSDWIWGDPTHTSYLFAQWLTAGEFSTCLFLADLLGPGLKGAGVWIQRPHLPPDPEDQIFMARKCVGFLWHHEVTAASILLSIVKFGHPKARLEAEALLFDPLLLSYGGDLRVFLEEQCSHSSKRVSECAKLLISKHDAHIAGIDRAQDLVELRPSIEQRRAVAMKDRDRNRDIQKRAQERSIFASLMTHQTLLYGRKSFSIVYGAEGAKHPNISALSEFSHSVELPRLMVIDPVGFNARITMLRAMKRKPT
jgi:hypothetical protein